MELLFPDMGTLERVVPFVSYIDHTPFILSGRQARCYKIVVAL